MAVSVGPVAGTELFIDDPGASPTFTVSIGSISNLGDLLQQFNEVKIEALDSGTTYSLKGTEEFPNISLVLNRKDDDAGQIALKAASAATRGDLYNFKILEVDGGTSIWKGEVFGYGTAYGGVNNVRMVKTSISIRPETLTVTLGT